MAAPAETLQQTNFTAELNQQPLESIERHKSFDVLASVDLCKFDLQTFGHVLPETRQRVYDEELTHIAEGVNRPLDTSFTLRENNGQLVIFDKGKWVPYQSTMLLKGWQIAELEAKIDPRRNFLAERAAKDYIIGQQFAGLNQDEKITWYSPFPEQEYQDYGQEFIDSLGFQSDRKLGFMYTATKNSDGSVTLRSRSVDNSDEDAFVAAIDKTNEMDADLDDGIDTYDNVMAQKYGGQFNAGRRVGHTPEENAWNLIEQHQDLLHFYFKKIEQLAEQNLPRADLEIDKKRLTYGVWAALKERLDRQFIVNNYSQNYGTSYNDQKIGAEVAQAYQTFSSRGEVMPGCGGSISGESAILEASSDSVFDSIFGSASSDRYGSLKFKCPKGHTNTRPPGKLLSHCQKCGVSVKC